MQTCFANLKKIMISSTERQTLDFFPASAVDWNGCWPLLVSHWGQLLKQGERQGWTHDQQLQRVFQYVYSMYIGNSNMHTFTCVEEFFYHPNKVVSVKGQKRVRIRNFGIGISSFLWAASCCWRPDVLRHLLLVPVNLKAKETVAAMGRSRLAIS